MRKIFVLWAREVKFFFHTPSAVVILPLYLVLCGIFFYGSLQSFYKLSQPGELISKAQGLNVTAHLLIPFFKNVLNVIIFVVPLITMRVFSEERKSGTYEILVSYPVRPFQIIMGKYLGILTISIILLALSFVFSSIIMWKGEPYTPQIFSTYLGYFLFIVLYNAFGLLISLMTENQIIAAIGTYSLYFSTYLFSWLAYSLAAPFDKFFANYLIISHLESFTNGMIFSGDIFTYLCTTVIILAIATHKLKKHYAAA